MTKEIMAECLEEAAELIPIIRKYVSDNSQMIRASQLVPIAAALYQERMRGRPTKVLPNGGQVEWRWRKSEDVSDRPQASYSP